MAFDNKEELVLRPMNCPHHITIYQHGLHSYRDLPMRLAELGTMYRYERSGVLSGLSRVRAMTLNDAHIFCTPEQIQAEAVGVLRLIERVYKDFGFKDYWYRLSLRNPSDKANFVANDAMWDTAEAHLRQRGGLEVGPPDPLMVEVRGVLQSAVVEENEGIRALDSGDFKAAAAHFRKAQSLNLAPTKKFCSRLDCRWSSRTGFALRIPMARWAPMCPWWLSNMNAGRRRLRPVF